MIVVTGGAGFIGSNIVYGLNQKGIDNIIVVDDLQDGTKFRNLVDCKIADYLDKDSFMESIKSGKISAGKLQAIIHQGACSNTTEWNGKFMMENNYEYSKQLLHFALEQKLPFIYASSAAVYGAGKIFKENLQYEKPLNVYGYSKFLFDQYVRKLLPAAKSQIVGLRYFNVYGPRESHKGSMASVAFHNHNQISAAALVKLFEGTDNYRNGEQRRDFIYIDDVVQVNLWFLSHADKSGIFNVGTGQAQTFNEVSQAVIDWHQKGRIEYIPFPAALEGSYQSFTQADISALRQAGYDQKFHTVQEGVTKYLDWLAVK